MTNPKIKALLYEVMADDEKYKLTLINDIMRGVKLAYGLGDEDSKRVLDSPGDCFDELYALSINELQILDATTALKVNKLMNIKIKENEKRD